MKNTLLISAAAAVLLAGTALAPAQSTMDKRLPPAASQQKAPEIEKSESMEQKSKAGAQIKSDQKPALDAQTNEKAGVTTETTGQAPAPKIQQEMKTQQETQDDVKPQSTQSKSGADAAAQGQSSGSAGVSAQGKTKTEAGSPPATQGSGAASASVSLTAEQKSKIRQSVISQSNAPRVSDVNFSLSVGTVVPRTVRVAPLPVVIIEIHPVWRGYLYFIVGDQIVIVEPDTLRIVAIITV